MTLAYWCVLVAICLPLLWTAVAKWKAPGFDNQTPRVFQTQLSGWRARAHWAHLNAFEAIPGFAAAVIIASLVLGNRAQIDNVALLFIAARVAHGYAYITDRALWRSIFYGIGLLCVIGLFVLAARG